MISTNFAYEVDSLPPLLTVAEFDELGGDQLAADDAQKTAVIKAVSQVVRDYCGWHVAPNVQCRIFTDGEHNFLSLPVMAVTNVSSVKIHGSEVENYEWTRSGLVRVPGSCFPNSWRSVEIDFRAGFTSSDALAQIVAQIAINNLVASAGLREEHAGQVGATYNQTDNGVSGGVRLLASDKAILAPYRLAF